MENQVQTNEVTPVVQQPVKKGMPAWAIVLIVLGAVGVLSVIVMVVAAFTITGKLLSEYQGTWTCNNSYYGYDIDLVNFKFYQGAGDYNVAKGTYKLEDTRPEGSTHKYTLTVTYNDVIANGERQSNAYMSQYEMTIDTNNKNAMKVYNKTTGYTYNCTKK